MTDPATIRRLLDVCAALGSLVDDLVFVGGAVAPLLVTSPVAPMPRSTDDTDLVHGASTRARFYEIEANLGALGFTQNVSGGDPICRWYRGTIAIDVVPDDPALLGFSNRWYRQACQTAVPMNLEGTSIRVIDAVHFLATNSRHSATADVTTTRPATISRTS